MYDVAVIGAGITGLYLAYRLVTQGQKVIIFEASSRIGGHIASISLPDTSNYKAEAAAERFLGDQEIVIALVNKLGLRTRPLPNFKAVLNPKTRSYIDKTKTLPQSYEIAFPNAVIATSGSAALLELFKTTGYPLTSLVPLPLPIALDELSNFNQAEQYTFVDGYEFFVEKLWQSLVAKDKVTLLLNTPVKRVDKSATCWLINETFQVKNVAFTSTTQDFANIQSNSLQLQERQRFALKNFFTYTACKMYLYFEKPWWTKEQIFSGENFTLLFNQILYFSEKVLLIYNAMNDATLLMNFVPPVLRQRPFSWILLQEHEGFANFLSQELTKYLGLSVPVPTAMAFSYFQECVQFMRPQDEYLEKLEKLTKGENFFLVSANYTTRPGWVENSFQEVEKTLPLL